MIKVDEEDPIGEVELSFPYRKVEIKRNVEPKSLYDLESELGRGKFGTVYKCKEKSTGLKLAAKFVATPKKEDRRNVEREVEIMRQLQHPRLLQLYDAFENGKVMCLILELIEGGELFERVIDDDFILTERSCTVFMRQICDGVDFIHKQKILHLDMKPENILCLTKTGNRIKIIDFGLARKYDPDKKLQVLFGTPEFVAPEVVNFDRIGYGTDMWSVGVICYVLLSGLSPFMGSTDLETMANVTIAKYDFYDDAFQDISENAKDFIRKLLLKDINSRMTAEECLSHNWLKRDDPKKNLVSASTPADQNYEMEATKDNLKVFVERWNEHPNSPYVFEMTSHIISPIHHNHPLSSLTHLKHIQEDTKLSGSFHSLVGMSPSPCGSLASSLESEQGFFENLHREHEIEDQPQLEHIRRASDSTCVVKTPDVSERINLAEEIKKLSDRLFQLSTMSTSFKMNGDSNGYNSERGNKKFNEKTIRYLNSKKTEENTTSKSKNLNVTVKNGEVPWRKSKFKISSSSRDVPLAPKHQSSKSFQEQFHSRLSIFNGTTEYKRCSTFRAHPQINSPSGTKDLLLRLLDQWDGPSQSPISRHGSISAEWSGEDTLGQKTISSLNAFFQTRAGRKMTTNI